MDKRAVVIKAFKNSGGILKTSDLNKLGLYSRQINKLIKDKEIKRIKRGFYELVAYTYPEEIVIARLFPHAVIFLESALFVYGYTDRIPSAWQIAVDKDNEKSQYEIEYPLINVFYMEGKLLTLGVEINQIEGVNVKVFNRDRTICDLIRYENKITREVFTNAIQRYVQDPEKDLKRLQEYSEILNIKNKVRLFIELWL